MEFLYFALLGLVQGLTEFLPVSSSGHLVFLDKIFAVETGNFLFVSILLHVATLFSVVVLYRKTIFDLIKNPFQKQAKLIIVATIPTVVIVLLFKGFFESSFGGDYLPVCFMFTAILLMITYFKTKVKKGYKPFGYTTALGVGFMQGLAVLPGISRSGSTISTAVLMGQDANEATSFSFLLSIPIIVASLAYEIYSSVKSGAQFFVGNPLYLIASFVLAFVSGLFAIKIMKKFAKTGKYYIFSIYLVILSVITCFI